MGLADEKARRRAKKQRVQQDMQHAEERSQTLEKAKVILVIFLVLAGIIAGLVVVFARKQQKVDAEKHDLLTIELENIMGTVHATSEDGSSPMTVDSTTQDFSGPTTFETGDDGKLIIAFSNDVGISLLPNTTLRIETLELSTKSKGILMECSMGTGACVIKGSPIPESMILKTPMAKMNCQGRGYARFKVEVEMQYERVASDKAVVKVEFTAGDSGGENLWKVLRPLKQLKITSKGISDPRSFSPLSEVW